MFPETVDPIMWLISPKVSTRSLSRWSRFCSQSILHCQSDRRASQFKRIHFQSKPSHGHARQNEQANKFRPSLIGKRSIVQRWREYDIAATRVAAVIIALANQFSRAHRHSGRRDATLAPMD